MVQKINAPKGIDPSQTIFEDLNPSKAKNDVQSSQYDKRERFMGYFKPNANVLVVIFLCTDKEQ